MRIDNASVESDRSKIFLGHVMHARLEPVLHKFAYSVYWYSFDLDELGSLPSSSWLFGYNKFRPVSINDSDYLNDGPGSIREKLIKYLERAGCGDGIRRIELVTSARLFNYAFNPVSFYYCYREDGSVRCMVAEINNTYNERHLYILNEERRHGPGFVTRYTVPKSFHVSPFNKIEGEYDFHFSKLDEKLDIKINILKDGREVFVSRMWGKSKPFSTMNLLKTLLVFPLTTVLTIPRIYWQAQKLYYMKKLPFLEKPNPSSVLTIKVAPPTWSERIAIKLVKRVLNRLSKGELTLIYPNGDVETYGSGFSKEKAVVKLRSYKVFPKVLKDGGIGLGEAYVDGDWESDDLPGVLAFFLNNSDEADERHFNLLWPFRFFNRMRHWFRRNSIDNAKENIMAHYNLSNELFKLFLDPSLTYSSGIFPTPDTTLEEAQQVKIKAMLEKARVKESDRLLEIGSGWGALAIKAAKEIGCAVTSISLSSEQLAVARTRALESGLSEKINFELTDYRHVSGSYDKIVSVEMLEAVGKEYLGDFFAACERLLKPNGVAAIQVICSPDSWYERYCKRQDWIQKHVFPGSHLPCLSALMEAIQKNSDFLVEEIQNIGPHYAPTLRLWREKFDAASAQVKALGFDERFIRLWRFYLASCEAEFATRWLMVYQIVLTRPNNLSISPVQINSVRSEEFLKARND